jgi:hypothetical protein
MLVLVPHKPGTIVSMSVIREPPVLFKDDTPDALAEVSKVLAALK